MAVTDKVDLWFSSDGDFAIENGDLKDTSALYGRSLLQEIRTRLQTTRGDWRLNSMLGANLEEFLGDPGTMANINRVASAMSYSLTFDNLIPSGDIEIIPYPLNESIVLFRIIVQTQRGELTLTMAYDSDQSRFMGN